jgi:hypothetical protein
VQGSISRNFQEVFPFEAGVTDTIPNTVRVEVNSVQKTSFNIHGLTLVYTPIPFNLNLEVDLNFELYITMVVQTSLETMSESIPLIDIKFESLINIHKKGTGFNTGLQLEIPDITANTIKSYCKYFETCEELPF